MSRLAGAIEQRQAPRTVDGRIAWLTLTWALLRQATARGALATAGRPDEPRPTVRRGQAPRTRRWVDRGSLESGRTRGVR